jgi:hypothetical protein
LVRDGALDHGGSRLIAGGFNAQNDHRCIIWSRQCRNAVAT